MLAAGRVDDTPQPPQAPTLIYDGNCGFCTSWVRWAKRLDTQDSVRTVALQDPEATELSGQSVASLRQAAHFVRTDGAVFAGAAAAREFAAFLRGGRLVRTVAAIPGVMPLAELVYGWVARTWGPVRRQAVGEVDDK
jgi:predicted DCC family thiol-disulfide oxidoreductase YuxK